MVHRKIMGAALGLAAAGSLLGSGAFAQSFNLSSSKNRPPLRVGVNPVRLLTKSFGLELGVSIDEHVLVGGQGYYNARSTYKDDLWIKGSSFGLTGSYFFNQVNADSIYASVSYDFDILKFGAGDGYHLNTGENSVNLDRHALTGMGGYQWAWNSGLSVGVGVGVSFASFSKNRKEFEFVRLNLERDRVEKLTYSLNKGPVPVAELRVSYTI